MAPIPRALDPAGDSPDPQALPFGGGFRGKVGGAITAAQILAIGESLAGADHRKVDRSAIAEHLSHGPPVTVFRVNPKGHLSAHGGQLLQLLAGCSPIRPLGSLWGIDAGKANSHPLGTIGNPDGVAIAHRYHRGRSGRGRQEGKEQERQGANHWGFTAPALSQLAAFWILASDCDRHR